MDPEERKKAVQKILVTVPEYIQKVQCDTDNRTAPFKCAVSSCTNIFLSYEQRNNYPYKFHKFPKDEQLCSVWKRQCGLAEETAVSCSMVCSDHFSLDDYIRNYKQEFTNSGFKRKLRKDAIPQTHLTNNLNRIEVSVNSSNSEASENCSDDDIEWNIAEVKKTVKDSSCLEEELESLLKEKRDIEKKIFINERRIEGKLKELIKLKEVLSDKRINRNIAFKGRPKNYVVQRVFSKAQINLLLGKKKVFWSDDDLAKAFTLRHIGSKECYLYLKNTLNIPLPSLSCVQKWAASYRDNSAN